MIDFYSIPVSQIRDIKEGADFVTPDGTLVKNELLTNPPGTPSRKYAYCSDTAYSPEIIPYIENVDLLYHEATFAESELVRAGETFHSTARQAAEIAKASNVKKTDHRTLLVPIQRAWDTFERSYYSIPQH